MRRFFALSALTVLFGSTLFGPALASDEPPRTALPAPVQGHEVTQIGPGYYTFRYTGVRNIFLITRDGVIVTDPIEPEAATVLRAEIRKLTPLPVKYVIYSHQHWDHVRGGRIFADADFHWRSACAEARRAQARAALARCQPR